VTVYGYARVSTANQSLLPQQVALRDAGASVVVTEKVSGTFPERPALDGLVKSLVPGDGLLVVRLDRLGRSCRTWSLIEDLSERGVSVMSLHEQIDTSSANGRLMVSLFAALAQFERDLISERTKAGLAAARLRRKGARASLCDDF
jgi:Site-specific recombinases, DNA invertase Pin homologs